jgi:hypothetical protein
MTCGEGLSGDEIFVVPPFSTKTYLNIIFRYELMYLPIKVETSSGFLSFMNPKLGELWYELTLVAS